MNCISRLFPCLWPPKLEVSNIFESAITDCERPDLLIEEPERPPERRISIPNDPSVYRYTPPKIIEEAEGEEQPTNGDYSKIESE